MNVTETVETLIHTDLDTVLIAVKEGDLTLMRMKDGTPPTVEQRALILDAGPDDFEAAVQELRARAAAAESTAFGAERITTILGKYDAAPGEPLGEILPRMTPNDRAEVLSLIRWIQTEDARLGDVDQYTTRGPDGPPEG